MRSSDEVEAAYSGTTRYHLAAQPQPGQAARIRQRRAGRGRGIPARPRKCCGKKVKFTPINIIPKWILVHVLWRVYPVNSGNQCTKAPIMANTAPIDST